MMEAKLRQQNLYAHQQHPEREDQLDSKLSCDAEPVCGLLREFERAIRDPRLAQRSPRMTEKY